MPAATANSARVLFRLPSQAPPLGVSRIVAAVLLATVVTWVHSAAYAAVTAAYDQQPDGYDGMPTVASTQSIAHADLGTPAASASPGTSGFVYESSGYLVATNTTGLADDVARVGDDAFSYGYDYHPRIRERGLQNPVGHNFPHSYDDVILRSTPVTQADGALLYRVPGSINGKDGFFEIALNPNIQTIFHRIFVGG